MYYHRLGWQFANNNNTSDYLWNTVNVPGSVWHFVFILVIPCEVGAIVFSFKDEKASAQLSSLPKVA